jgi:hypothetical protein
MGWSARPIRRRACARWALAGVVSALAAGCQIEADYGGTSFLCAEREACPPGFSCRDGLCLSDDAPDAGTSCDAATAAGVLAAGFAAGDLWESDTQEGAELAIEGSELVISLGPQGASSATLTSRCSVNVSGARVAVEVQSVPERAAVAIEALAPSGGDRFAFEIDDGALLMVFDQDGSRQQATLNYLPAEHRYLALSERDGYAYFETSADGATWQIERSHAAPDFLTAISLRFGARSSPPGASGEVRLGDLRAVDLEAP